ncbi:MAG: phenylalanine--tRNA ligase subunit alpha [Myxococcales bacterium]|nr:phenylalanine--tRNA ligase subunit alpha [Myxococcales bacterium]|tara:strand:- start:415 stop:1467 length:1053 start_codon:yes stop_codon:yes gene_type:complete
MGSPNQTTDISELVEALNLLRDEAERDLPQASSEQDLEQLRVAFLGKKGKLSGVLRMMGKLPKDARPEAGKVANGVRDRINGLLTENAQRLEDAKMAAALQERIDVTLPGRAPLSGGQHILNQTRDLILDVLKGLGFEMARGPEVEHDFYNFEALNIPEEHPARDMQDTFYIADRVVLRTHTSPVQIRSMMSAKTPPLRVACFGRVYRHDHDVTHSPMFHQIEGLFVDKNVSMADLKGTLEIFTQKIFDDEAKVRLRPSFFPFTEPSVEVDISCFACKGAGCRLCSHTGWIEIMGAGMVDPEVFKMSGYDPEECTGFAFGIGVERVAMLRHGISDIRLFFENDLRFLKQF